MRPLALALVPLLLLPGCGGDDGGGGEPGLEERRERYVSSAEQVCADANAELEELTVPTSVEGVPEYADAVVDVARQTAEDVQSLEPPEEDADELRTKVLDPLSADLEAGEAYAEQLRAAAEAGDGAALLRLVGELPQTSADLDFMREYGLVECAGVLDNTG